MVTLSNNAIQSRKLETLEAQALRRTVAAREIEVIDEKTILFNGKQIKITRRDIPIVILIDNCKYSISY